MKHILLRTGLSLLTLLLVLSVTAQTAEVLESISIQNLTSGIETSTVFDYDLQGNVISELDTEYNPDSETWANAERRTFTHSSDQIVKLKEEWIVDSWVNKDQWTYIQNDAGQDIVKEFVVWGGSEFVNNQRNEITYNSSGQRIESAFLQHDGAGGWSDNYKYTYGYDDNGNSNLVFRYNYNEGLELFEPYKRWTYTRDLNGNIIDRVESNYDMGSWINYRNRTYNNTADGEVNYIIYQDFNTTTGGYESTNRRDYTYNAQGNIASMAYTDNPTDFAGAPQYQYDYGYEGLSADLVILPYYYDEGYRNDHYQDEKLAASDYSYRNSVTNLLEPLIAETRTYSIFDGYVGVEDIAAENILVYPNPTSDIIFLPKDIQGEYVSVYNMSGLLTKTALKSNNSQLDVSELTSGNYILKIETEKGIFTSKFQKL